MTRKILDLKSLADVVETLRNQGKRIVLCHGCFDLLHIGHIRYFHRAKEHGDILVATLTPDRFVDKGPSRPAFTEDLRAEALASLKEVDYVAINEWPTAVNTLRLLRPHVYAKGSEFKAERSDYTGKIDEEIKVLEEVGATMVFTEDIVFSSSNLINRFLSNKPEETQEYLQVFSTRYSTDQLNEMIDRMQSLRVLVVGDTILDEYRYCDALGKSNKDPVLAVLQRSHELFAGGVLAVANHIANFANKVTMCSLLGEEDRQEEFVRANLNPKVTPIFFTQPGAPTLLKRRYLDGYSFNKLLEIYIMNDKGLPEDLDAQFRARILEEIPKHDLVVVADFGHGTMSAATIAALCESKAFLCVNTQANAGNRGFHTITKYPRADCVSLAEHEIRLETRLVNGPLRPQVDGLAARLNTRIFVATRGRRGSLVRGRNDHFVQSPSLTTNVVDRIGAGDALFSISSLAAALSLDEEVVAFLGNVAGSLAVGIIGNQKSIDPMGVKKYITSLLK